MNEQPLNRQSDTPGATTTAGEASASQISASQIRVDASNYAVLFLDLLGHGKLLRGGALITGGEAEAHQLLDPVINDVLWLHGNFDRSYKMYSDISNNPALHAATRSFPIKYQYFSDGIVAYVNVGDGITPAAINGVYGLVATAGQICLRGLMERRPIRGGLAIACSAEIDGKELIGHGMADAYRLESKVAKGPRIAVGKNVRYYIEAMLNVEGDELEKRHVRDVAKMINGMICPDLDQVLMVDYLGNSFRKIGPSPEQRRQVFQRAEAFVNEQHAYWLAAGYPELVQKYFLTKSYFTHRAADWLATSPA